MGTPTQKVNNTTSQGGFGLHLPGTLTGLTGIIKKWNNGRFYHSVLHYSGIPMHAFNFNNKNITTTEGDGCLI